jgi:hypothetical protein
MPGVRIGHEKPHTAHALLRWLLRLGSEFANRILTKGSIIIVWHA